MEKDNLNIKKRNSSSGDWSMWNKIWREEEKLLDEKILYTEKEPTTLLQFWQKCYFDDLWSMMGNKAQDARYLELGSGRGTTSMYLSKAGCDVTMVDLSENAFKLAEKNFNMEGIDMPKKVVADARDTKLEEGGYDCIYNIGLLEHFEDPKPVLKEALRLLSPNGIIFMVVVPEVPTSRSLQIRLLLNPIRAILHVIKTRIKNLISTGQSKSEKLVLRTEFSKYDYKKWMIELGRDDAECVSYNPYHTVYKNKILERMITIPLYCWNIKNKKKKGGVLLTCKEKVALCDLLVCGDIKSILKEC